MNGADAVPLISNGEPCWAQPPHTTAGGVSDGASDIFTAVSVYLKKGERGGRSVLVSRVKVGMRRIFYIKCFYLYIPSALKDTMGTIKAFYRKVATYALCFPSSHNAKNQQQQAVNG